MASPITEKGDLPLSSLPQTPTAKQPGRTIIKKNDGTFEGNITFKSDSKTDFPEIGDLHPDNGNLECYNLAVTSNSLGLYTCQASYFGIEGSKTDPQVQYTGGSQSEPIETFPDFNLTVTGLAGTAANPNNDAVFDEETGEFIGFMDGELQGVQYYLVPSNTISVTYWQDTPPEVELMLIRSRPPGTQSFILPPVANWLLTASPVRSVGNFYQVSETWLGSAPGVGWNSAIYNPAF